MDRNRLNQILMLDSVPVSEGNLAKRLFEDIETHATFYSPSPAVQYLRIESREDFLNVVRQCQTNAEEHGTIPLLHIECHGCEEGLEFADQSFLSWSDLQRPLSDLNAATGLNLIVCVAACTGAALAKAFDVTVRAPFWGLIGPTKPLDAGALDTAYRAFYLTLLSTKSPSQAIAAMDVATSPGLFWRTTAEWLFQELWSTYEREYCNETSLEQRAVALQRLVIESMSPEASVPSLDSIKTDLLTTIGPQAFERTRRAFFMCDLFPEHADRFEVAYVGMRAR